MRLPPRVESQYTKPARRRTGLSKCGPQMRVCGHGGSGGGSRVQHDQQAAAAAAAMAATHAVLHLPWAHKIVPTCAQGLATVVQCHFWGDVALRIAASLFRQDAKAATASRRYDCALTTKPLHRGALLEVSDHQYSSVCCASDIISKPWRHPWLKLHRQTPLYPG
jgi:hypothetical protein